MRSIYIPLMTRFQYSLYIRHGYKIRRFSRHPTEERGTRRDLQPRLVRRGAASCAVGPPRRRGAASALRPSAVSSIPETGRSLSTACLPQSHPGPGRAAGLHITPPADPPIHYGRRDNSVVGRRPSTTGVAAGGPHTPLTLGRFPTTHSSRWPRKRTHTYRGRHQRTPSHGRSNGKAQDTQLKPHVTE